jgi:hypothetical protein
MVFVQQFSVTMRADLSPPVSGISIAKIKQTFIFNFADEIRIVPVIICLPISVLLSVSPFSLVCYFAIITILYPETIALARFPFAFVNGCSIIAILLPLPVLLSILPITLVARGFILTGLSFSVRTVF